ncbi:MAG: DUF255 domain-containing protein [Bacteroidota bacterium]|nr:DUF255 domain-containing protein [Bacteroidota bacterium]
MKKIVLYSLFLLIFSSFNKPAEEELKWYKWNDAYPLAQKEGKILLIDAYTDWCGWCKKMDRDTYSKQEVIQKINKHFIAVKFNPELRDLTYTIDGQTFSARDFYAQLNRGENNGFPTTYFIDPKKKSLFIDPGYRDAQTFIQILDKVIADK